MVEEVDCDVPDEVIHPIQRFSEVGGERLGGGDPHQQSPHQAGAGGHGDGVDLRQVDVGRGDGASQGGHEGRQVGTGCDLRHHSPETHVEVDGACDLVGQQVVAADDADARLVAGGLDPQDQRFAH